MGCENNLIQQRKIHFMLGQLDSALASFFYGARAKANAARADEMNRGRASVYQVALLKHEF
jgi:hypothetical protein